MQKYNAIAYARASKDDIDSSTIENQFELIKDYVESMPEVRIISCLADNGFSGVDFFRPSFETIMEKIKAGNVNCVIVKDLSRLGRNYIEVGELMNEVFPKHNVRLIAINDNYDSIEERTDSDEIIIPFKNLVNEHYLRDFSIKIRSHLSSKRKKGQHVSAFAPYGYTRDKVKHKLVVDEYASSIIQKIFKMKIDGMSQQGIANKLNEMGEPSPSEYKKLQGMNYNTPLQVNRKAIWSSVAITRILENPVYIGTLEQGKRTTPNYKVKKTLYTSKDEWSIVENAHEAIINKCDFETVKELLRQDTRIAPKNETVFPLSGILYCADCGNTMVRKKAGKYIYYVCGTYKNSKGCSSHTFSATELENTVMQAITHQISTVLNIEKSISYLQSLPSKDRHISISNEQIAHLKKELSDCEKYRRFLYEDFKNGEISKEDYIDFKKDYSNRINEINIAIEKIKQEVDLIFSNNTSSNIWIEHFIRYQNVKECTRNLITNLIVKIVVYEKKRIEIEFKYQDKFLIATKVIKDMLIKQKEVI